MIESVLANVLAVAIAVERLVEVIKPFYLKAKNAFLKHNDEECTKTEKIIMTVLVGPFICIVGGVGINISGVSAVGQQVLCGLIASIGSNVIHTLLNIVVAFKDIAEGFCPRK